MVQAFVTICQATTQLDEVSYHKLFDILKQYQKKLISSELKRMPRMLTHYTVSHALQRNKAKKAKPISTPTESGSERDIILNKPQRDKDMQKNLALIAKNKNVDTNPRYKNDNQSGQFGIRGCINVAGLDKLRCSTSSKQSDWLADTDEEIDEQELEAHYSYMAKIQEVPNADSGTDAEPLEHVQYDTDDNVFANDRHNI
ncbi:hypothetical protein Tco_0238049 [Tanacetum coccineum]